MWRFFTTPAGFGVQKALGWCGAASIGFNADPGRWISVEIARAHALAEECRQLKITPTSARAALVGDPDNRLRVHKTNLPSVEALGLSSAVLRGGTGKLVARAGGASPAKIPIRQRKPEWGTHSKTIQKWCAGRTTRPPPTSQFPIQRWTRMKGIELG